MMGQKQGRNTQCNCGSGKKFKNCCENKKARELYIETDWGLAHDIFPNGIIPSGNSAETFNINFNKGTFKNNSIEASFALKQSYKRHNKNDKVLRQLPIESFSLDYLFDNDSIHKLLTGFDLIFAIDTNTITVKDKLVSVAFCFMGNVYYTSENVIECKYGHFKNFEYNSLNPSEAEKKGVYDTIQSIISNKNYNEKLKIAIISDTDLIQHQKINNGEIPLLNEFFLPANFRLLYASADSGSENILNRLIKLCDKACTYKLKTLKQ